MNNVAFLSRISQLINFIDNFLSSIFKYFYSLAYFIRIQLNVHVKVNPHWLHRDSIPNQCNDCQVWNCKCFCLLYNCNSIALIHADKSFHKKNLIKIKMCSLSCQLKVLTSNLKWRLSQQSSDNPSQ